MSMVVIRKDYFWNTITMIQGKPKLEDMQRTHWQETFKATNNLNAVEKYN